MESGIASQQNKYLNFTNIRYSKCWSMSSGFMSNFSCSSAEGNITSYISLKGFILLIFLFLVLTKGAPTCKYCENMWTHDEKAMSCGISIPYALPESCINFLVGVLYGRCSLKFIGRQIMSRLYGSGKTCTITFFWTSWCSHSKEVMNRFSVLFWFFPTATFFLLFSTGDRVVWSFGRLSVVSSSVVVLLWN